VENAQQLKRNAGLPRAAGTRSRRTSPTSPGFVASTATSASDSGESGTVSAGDGHGGSPPSASPMAKIKPSQGQGQGGEAGRFSISVSGSGCLAAGRQGDSLLAVLLLGIGVIQRMC
jgi:hypothetical protein